MSRYVGPVCRLCRRETASSKTGEKVETLSERRSLPHPQVRGRAPRNRSWPEDAGQGATEGFRVRPSAARETEDAQVLWRSRNAVRELFPGSGAGAGTDRQDVSPASRAQIRQRRLSSEFGGEPRAGPSADFPPALPREREAGQHPVVHRQSRRCDHDRRAQRQIAGSSKRT